MGSPREKAIVPSTDEVAGAPSWELRMLLERAAELERLQRFEEALVLYHRGRKRAPLVTAFEEGVRRAAQAVDTAIGEGAATLFSDIPGLLPGMIHEQAAARSRSRRAARAAQDRRREAVRNMTFSEARPASRAREAADDDDDDDLDVVSAGEAARRRPGQHGVVALSSQPPGN